MKVLIAGATGVIGRPLVRQLLAAGHEPIGITRTTSGTAALAELGARSVLADAMDRDGLLRALEGLPADAVVHQLTALKKLPSRESSMATTNALRSEGTANLLAAAGAIGAGRFVTQAFYGGYGFYDHGTQVLTEEAPFARPGQGPFPRTLAAMRTAEEQAFSAEGIDGISLRYGAFYGPGATESILDMLRRRRVALPARSAETPFIHVDDAAAATVAALEHGRGGQAYNVADDQPVTFGAFLAALAETFGTRPPLRAPGWVLRLAAPYAGVLLTRTSMRLSNAKTKSELGWTPSAPTYREGIAATREAMTAASSR